MSNQKSSSDGEDIPSDFFDDFNKDEFMEGLSVIDSWDDEEKKKQSSRARINAEAISSVRDLRELIVREEDENRSYVAPHEKYRWKRKSPYSKEKSARYRPDDNHLDDYIKPGSRRDPSKTNAAIRKDKEVKVKEYLAKHLESNNDLCPPGTELDDFFEDRKSTEVKKHESLTKYSAGASPSRIVNKERMVSPMRRRRESPMKHRDSPPRYRRENLSPRRHFHSTQRKFRPYYRNQSPYRNNPKYYKRSPRRESPEFRRELRSRSPYKRYHRQTRSRSPDHKHEQFDEHRSRAKSSNHKSERDEFLYPKDYYPPEYSSVKTEMPYQVEPEPQYAKPTLVEYTDVPNYSYVQGQAYGGYGVPYDYGVQPAPQMLMPVPQPVPAPIIASTPLDPSTLNPVQPPAMVLPPHHIISPNVTNTNLIQKIPDKAQNTQVDALAKLVADGKLSHEDYLKLAPNKGVCKSMDTHTRVAVLNRCHDALSRLGNIILPNQLVINNSFIGSEQKQIVPKFCSPLKRQASTEFYFTKLNASAIVQQNKQVVDSIIATLRIEKIVEKKQKAQKNMKDAAVQTVKPFCDMCEIRENTKFSNVGTSIDNEHFSSAVQTQVVDQDLLSSKSMFNPTGGMTEGANISLAHMTPAQLVSQLAARAKTLKQSEPGHSSNQFRHQQNYDYEDRGGDNQYRKPYNYRY